MKIVQMLSRFSNALIAGNKMGAKLVLVGLLLLALCTTAAVAEGSLLRVTGAGTVETPTDTVIISVSARSTDDNATIATEKNSDLINKTKDALIAAGVKESDIMPERPKRYAKCYSVEYNTVNNSTTCKRVVTNQVTERMIIRLNTSDENETQKVIETAQSAGARATILGYALNNPDKAVADARKKSLDDARLRAEDYAAAYGLKLGKSIEIEELRYPRIEVGPSYGWDRPMRMHHHRSCGNRIPMMDRFYGFEGNYIPAGMADITAYTRVTYEVS